MNARHHHKVTRAAVLSSPQGLGPPRKWQRSIFDSVDAVEIKSGEPRVETRPKTLHMANWDWCNHVQTNNNPWKDEIHLWEMMRVFSIPYCP